MEKNGFAFRECKLLKSPSYMQEESGQIYDHSSFMYTRGYTSVYNAYLMKEILPKAMAEAKAILVARPSNWKNNLSEEQVKARMLFLNEP